MPEVFNLLTGELDSLVGRPGSELRRASVRRKLGGTMIGGGLMELGAEDRSAPYHFHYGEEEWVIVVSGAPVLRTPAGERELAPGDVVCFPKGPDGAHALRGPGRILIVSGRRSPETLEYPDSGKIAAVPPGKLFRAADAVDYWDGE